jgi:hypothetical protein
MSRTDARRPIRFLAVSELAQPAPQSQSDNHVAIAQSADRFRRTLSAASRRGGAAATPAETAAPREASAGSASQTSPSQGGRAPDSTLRAGTQNARSAKEPDAALRTAPLRASLPVLPASELVERVPEEDADPRFIDAAMPTLADAWPEQMAKMIGALCARADPAFVTWTVTVPMDPQVLPDTELRLHLSPHWLSLRFSTQSQGAARLISLHRPSLQSQLEHMANLPHGIDIEVI